MQHSFQKTGMDSRSKTSENTADKSDVNSKLLKLEGSSLVHSEQRDGYSDNQDQGAVCIECNTNFKWKNNLLRHKKSFHPYSGTPYQCEKCGMKLPALKLLNEHLRQHINAPVNTLVPSQKQMEMQQGTCREIIKDTPKEDAPEPTNQHINMEPGKDVKKLQNQKCEEPKLEAEQNTSVKILKDPSLQSKNDSLVEETSLQVTQGKLDEKDLVDDKEKVKKMIQYIINKPFPCQQCQRRFKSKAGLHLHSLTHTDNTQFQCTGCEKKFATSGLLKRHTKKHPEEFHLRILANERNKQVQIYKSANESSKEFQLHDSSKVGDEQLQLHNSAMESSKKFQLGNLTIEATGFKVHKSTDEKNEELRLCNSAKEITEEFQLLNSTKAATVSQLYNSAKEITEEFLVCNLANEATKFHLPNFAKGTTEEFQSGNSSKEATKFQLHISDKGTTEEFLLGNSAKETTKLQLPNLAKGTTEEFQLCNSAKEATKFRVPNSAKEATEEHKRKHKHKHKHRHKHKHKNRQLSMEPSSLYKTPEQATDEIEIINVDVSAKTYTKLNSAVHDNGDSIPLKSTGPNACSKGREVAVNFINGYGRQCDLPDPTKITDVENSRHSEQSLARVTGFNSGEGNTCTSFNAGERHQRTELGLGLPGNAQTPKRERFIKPMPRLIELDSTNIATRTMSTSINNTTSNGCNTSFTTGPRMSKEGQKLQSNIQTAEEFGESPRFRSHFEAEEMYPKHFRYHDSINSGVRFSSDQFDTLKYDPVLLQEPYKCNVCNATFILIWDLQKHVECHINMQQKITNYGGLQQGIETNNVQELCCSRGTTSGFHQLGNNGSNWHTPSNSQAFPLQQTSPQLQLSNPKCARCHVDQCEVSHFEMSNNEPARMNNYQLTNTEATERHAFRNRNAPDESVSNNCGKFLSTAREESDIRWRCTEREQRQVSAGTWGNSQLYSAGNVGNSSFLEFGIGHDRDTRFSDISGEPHMPQCLCNEVVQPKFSSNQQYNNDTLVRNDSTSQSSFCAPLHKVQQTHACNQAWLHNANDQSAKPQLPYSENTTNFNSVGPFHTFNLESFPLQQVRESAPKDTFKHGVNENLDGMTQLQLNSNTTRMHNLSEDIISANTWKGRDYICDNTNTVSEVESNLNLPAAGTSQQFSSVSSSCNSSFSCTNQQCQCKITKGLYNSATTLPSTYSSSNTNLQNSEQLKTNKYFHEQRTDENRTTIPRYSEGNTVSFNNYPVLRPRISLTDDNPVPEYSENIPSCSSVAQKKILHVNKPDIKILLGDNGNSNGTVSLASAKDACPNISSNKMNSVLLPCKTMFNNQPKLPPNAKGGRKAFKCVTCNLRFKTSRGLKCHGRFHKPKPAKVGPGNKTNVGGEQMHIKPITTKRSYKKANCTDVGARTIDMVNTRSTQSGVPKNFDFYRNEAEPKQADETSNFNQHDSSNGFLLNKNSSNSSPLTVSGKSSALNGVCSENTTTTPVSSMNTTGVKLWRYQCPMCQLRFQYQLQLRLHVTGTHKDSYYQCTLCNQTFLREQTWERHQALHKNTVDSSPVCSKQATSILEKSLMKKIAIGRISPVNDDVTIETYEPNLTDKVNVGTNSDAISNCSAALLKPNISPSNCEASQSKDANTQFSAKLSSPSLKHDRVVDSENVDVGTNSGHLLSSEIPDLLVEPNYITNRLSKRGQTPCKENMGRPPIAIVQNDALIKMEPAAQHTNDNYSPAQDDVTILYEKGSSTSLPDIRDVANPTLNLLSGNAVDHKASEGIQFAIEAGIQKLLPSLCGEDMLLSLGWPTRNVRRLLYDILVTCGKKPYDISCINENCKLLFEVAIGEEASKSLLATNSIQEVIDKLLDVS